MNLQTRNFRFKTVLAILLVTVLTTAAFTYLAFSPASFDLPDIYMDALPSSASFVIDTDGTNIWAINGTTGQIETDLSGTNASQVIQNALDLAGETWAYSGYGGIVFLRSGTYTVDTTIYMRYYNLALVGENVNSVILDTTATCENVIEPDLSEGNAPMHCRIEKLTIDGYTNPTKIGIYANSVTGWQVRDVRIVGFNGTGGIGLKLYGNTTSGQDTTFFNSYNLHVSYCTTGILFEGSANYFAPNANTFHGGQIQYCPVGLNLSQGNGNHFYSMTFENPLGSTDTAVLIGNSTYTNAKHNTFIGLTIETYEYGFNLTSSAFCNIIMGTKFSAVDSGNCWNDEGAGGVRANWLIGQGDTTGDYLGINWVYFDEIEGWARSGPILKNYYGSLMLKGGFYPETDETYWLGTMNQAWAGAYFQATEPNTTGWGVNRAGAFWYDKSDNRFEYWNGSAIYYLDSTAQP